MYDDEKCYYLVNPAGAIHQVPETLTKIRLKSAGWRLATKDEIAKLFRNKGVQNTKHMICNRWTSLPPEDQELPDMEPKKAKTPKGK